MARWEWLEKYVDGKADCPYCHRPAIAREKREMEPFLPIQDLSKMYGASIEELLHLIRSGVFRFYETDEPNPGNVRYFLRESEVSKRFKRAVEIIDQPLICDMVEGSS